MSEFKTKPIELDREFTALFGIKYAHEIPDYEKEMRLMIIRCKRKLTHIKELKIKHKIKPKHTVKPVVFTNNDFKW